MAVAQFEIKMVCRLDSPVVPKKLLGTFFASDNAAHKIKIAVYAPDGTKAALGNSASVLLYIARSDGTTNQTTVTGAVSGNVVTITLPAAAYTVKGPVTINMKLSIGGVVTTIGVLKTDVR